MSLYQLAIQDKPTYTNAELDEIKDFLAMADSLKIHSNRDLEYRELELFSWILVQKVAYRFGVLSKTKQSLLKGITGWTFEYDAFDLDALEHLFNLYTMRKNVPVSAVAA